MNESLSVHVEWSSDCNLPEIDSDLVIKNIEMLLKYLSPSFIISLDISVMVTTDKIMKEINLERRGFDKTTDVLSFPLLTIENKLPFQILGEVVISMDTCRFQAKNIGHSILDEFYRLLVHGILHLFGYDHETNERDAEIMRKKEDECLDKIFLDNGNL